MTETTTPSKQDAKGSGSIVIKKVKKGGHGHHGGAWKIAYADFVTAMMAFFLLMWLLGSVNKSQKEGIAEYFKQPIKIALINGDSVGSREKIKDGGGDNLDRKDGQVNAQNVPPSPVSPSKTPPTPAEMQVQQENQNLKDLQQKVQKIMDSDVSLAELKNQVMMDITSEGLRIQLIDNKDRPMFGSGSDEMDPEVFNGLGKLAALINTVPNKITIQGHTDAHPFMNPLEPNQTNWELSTLRANAARRALIGAGMREDKVMRVTGYASTFPLDKTDPMSPKNRRISIIVMKNDASEKALE